MSDNHHIEDELLQTPISFKDLTTTGTRILIKADYDNVDDECDDFLITDEPCGTVTSPWSHSFAELKVSMVDIGDGIFKKMSIEGYGETMPAKARVKIHYNGYWEHDSMPFDSTNLRGKPKSFVTECQDILIGLEKSVLSMRRGEESHFVIPYQLLYGEIGCPPRIRAKADGLFVINVLDFDETGDQDIANQLSAENQRKFSVVIVKINEAIARGRDLFKQRLLKQAAHTFYVAVQKLETSILENEDEQKQQVDLIIKLYTNLAITYNMLNEPKLACKMCNMLRNFTVLENYCKGLFQEGRALFKIGDYKRAKEKLTRCLKLEPSSKAILDELESLEVKFQAFKAAENEMCRKAFSMMAVAKTNKLEASAVKETDNVTDQKLEKWIKEFKNSKSRILYLPTALLPGEIQRARELAIKYEVSLENAQRGGYVLVNRQLDS